MPGLSIHLKRHPEINPFYMVLIDLFGFNNLTSFNETHGNSLNKIRETKKGIEEMRDFKSSKLKNAISRHLEDDILFIESDDSPLKKIEDQYIKIAREIITQYLPIIPLSGKDHQRLFSHIGDILMDTGTDIYIFRQEPELENKLFESMRKADLGEISKELNGIYGHKLSYYEKFLNDFRENCPDYKSIRSLLETLRKYQTRIMFPPLSKFKNLSVVMSLTNQKSIDYLEKRFREISAGYDAAFINEIANYKIKN